MKMSVIIIIASLTCAIAFTIAAEKSKSGFGALMARAALLAIYGVCVGIISAVLTYFFSLGEFAALAIGIPLGVPALFVAARISEA